MEFWSLLIEIGGVLELSIVSRSFMMFFIFLFFYFFIFFIFFFAHDVFIFMGCIY